MRNKAIHKIYFSTLILFCAVMSFLGFACLARLPQVTETIHHLGYPSYFSMYIGVCKIIGVIFLWLMPVKFLKEFAYGGFFFLLGSAILSQLIAGGSALIILLTFILLLVLALNYYCYYQTDLKKQDDKFFMYLIHKKIKENERVTEQVHDYSDAG